MCGIAGLIRWEAAVPEDAEAVRRMTEAQIHRGPDGEGLYQNGRAVLGHRRLSIIDLSPAAQQPMSNENGSVWVTFNGEIYNFPELRGELAARGHVFRSQSDTEVIVHGYEEWGIEPLLAKLRGMFAFGLYDIRRGLILARDRLGIKPLYYFESRGTLVFASEVRALLRSGLAPSERDADALAGFLLTGSVPAPLTTIKGVRCLLPGHYLVYEHGAASVRKYWDLPLEPGERHNGKPAGELRARLDDAVTRHLVSDVPLGVFLSGGLDSAALVAVAHGARQGQNGPLVTLTISFAEQEFSEAPQAREFAARFGTRHHEVPVTAADFRREWPALFAAMDQPSNDGVNTYFVSKAAREAGLTVVLSGLGGDEVFWGYRHYRWLTGGAGWLRRCPAPARRALACGASAWGRFRGRESWRRAAFLSGECSAWGLYLTLRGFFAPQQAARLLGIGEAELRAAAEKHVAVPRPGDGASAAGFNYLEIKRYLHDQLLRDTDAFSMAHSIEVRVPYLDHAVVEWAAGIRPALKVGNGVNKPLLVDAVNDPLLRAAAARKKRGFSFPMAPWMKSCAGELEEMACRAGDLDRTAVRGLWQDFRDGRLHWSRAWALSVLGAVGQASAR